MSDDAPSEFLAKGARMLAAPENASLRHLLSVFVDMWGMDCYTPPEEVDDAVRQMVRAFLKAAEMEIREAGN